MHYRIFDFDIQSDIPLPCDARLADPSLEPARWNLEIVLRSRSDWVFSSATLIASRPDICAYSVGDGVLISYSDGLKMYCRGDGGRIEVHLDGSNCWQEGWVAIRLINIGIAVCHLLRGAIPLHCGSVELEGRLFGVMAASGTGKSTLLWSLLDSDALFYGDDSLPIYLNQSEVLSAPSNSLHAKLPGYTLEKRGLLRECFQEVAPEIDHFWLPIDIGRRSFSRRTPSALFALSPFVLSKADSQTAPIFVQRYTGADAILPLLANTQGLWVVNGLLDSKALMKRYLQLAQQVPIFTLHYAREFSVLPRVRDALANIVSKTSTSVL